MNQRLPRNLRIHEPALIRLILATGRKYTGNLLILFCLPAPDSRLLTRAGFLSPKRIGKAVKRNRVRRQLREIFRRHRTEIAGSQQLLLMGRTSAIGADYRTLTDDFLRLCRKARLLSLRDP